MGKITVRRPISIVAIMTEKFRDELIRESERTLKTIEEDMKKIEEESVRYIASVSQENPQQGATLKQQIEHEKERLKATKAQLEVKLKDLENIEDGKEVTFQTLDGLAEIEVGTNLFNAISKTVIVIKDWVVVEIREN